MFLRLQSHALHAEDSFSPLKRVHKKRVQSSASSLQSPLGHGWAMLGLVQEEVTPSSVESAMSSGLRPRPPSAPLAPVERARIVGRPELRKARRLSHTTLKTEP